MKKTVLTFFTVSCLLSAAFLMRLALNVQIAEADYTWTETIHIKADGSVEPLTAPISTADSITYTLTDDIVGDVPSGSEAIVVERDNIVVDGAGYTLQGTGSSTGIGLGGRSNVTIKNANIKNFEYGIRLWDSSNHNSVSGNDIANKKGGIRLDHSSNNSISGNNVTANSYYGIWLSSSSNNSVSGNNIANNGYGIQLGSSNYNIISGNNIANNSNGVFLGFPSSGNLISGNNVTNNNTGIVSEYGHTTSNNIISGNNIENNGGGIRLPSSKSTIVSENNITNNGIGIRLYHHFSNNNTISGNNIAGNNIGIELEESSNNTIYHNSFINNINQVRLYVLYASLYNVWDNGYPSGGNYWSNYTGVDSDHDGIGDTVHVIDENNQDNYPLMGMFSDFTATSEQHVQIICNSTISDFQFNGTAISFSVTGEDGTVGFCRTCIPTALMNDTYTALVNGTEVPHTLLPFSNSTHNYLYFTYNHSTQDVVIIPEFPSALILPLLLAVTFGVVVLLKKRRLSVKDT